MMQSQQLSQLREALESAYDRGSMPQVELISRQIDAIAMSCIASLCAAAQDAQPLLAREA